jgi:hypothetical protein
MHPQPKQGSPLPQTLFCAAAMLWAMNTRAFKDHMRQGSGYDGREGKP